MTPPAEPGMPSRIPPIGALVLRWEGVLKRFVRERPRAAAMTAFALLMAMLLSVYSASPGEARFTGDLGGTTLFVNGVTLAGAEVTVWPAGKFEVTVRREGQADVMLRAEVEAQEPRLLWIPVLIGVICGIGLRVWLAAA